MTRRHVACAVHFQALAAGASLRQVVENWRLTTNVLVPTTADLLTMGNALAVQFDGLVYEFWQAVEALRIADADCKATEDELAEARGECDQLHTEIYDREHGYPTLIQLIRWEHDEHHPQPFTICEHEVCRQAGALL